MLCHRPEVPSSNESYNPSRSPHQSQVVRKGRHAGHQSGVFPERDHSQWCSLMTEAVRAIYWHSVWLTLQIGFGAWCAVGNRVPCHGIGLVRERAPDRARTVRSPPDQLLLGKREGTRKNACIVGGFHVISQHLRDVW